MGKEARIKLFWRLLWHGRWRPIAGSVLVIGLYDTLAGEFLPDLPRVGTLLPQIDWWGWVILLLVIILLAVLEGAYKMINKITKERDEAEAERDELLTKTKDQIINPILALIDEAEDKCKKHDHSWFNDERFEDIGYKYKPSYEVNAYGRNVIETGGWKICRFCGHTGGDLII